MASLLLPQGREPRKNLLRIASASGDGGCYGPGGGCGSPRAEARRGAREGERRLWGHGAIPRWQGIFPRPSVAGRLGARLGQASGVQHGLAGAGHRGALAREEPPSPVPSREQEQDVLLLRQARAGAGSCIAHTVVTAAAPLSSPGGRTNRSQLGAGSWQRPCCTHWGWVRSLTGAFGGRWSLPRVGA